MAISSFSRILLGFHPVVAHGLVPRGVGLDLGAVEGNGADLDQSGQCTELEDLNEEGFETSQVNLAKVADGAEVGDVLADNDAAGDIDVTSPHDLPRGPRAGGVAVQEQSDHHSGMEWRLAAKLAFVMGENGREVERGDGVEEEVDEVTLGKPVVRRGRKEVILVGGPISISLGQLGDLVRYEGSGRLGTTDGVASEWPGCRSLPKDSIGS